MPEFRQRVDVLRRLGYVAADNTVQLKVCCLSTARNPLGPAASHTLRVIITLCACPASAHSQQPGLCTAFSVLQAHVAAAMSMVGAATETSPTL